MRILGLIFLLAVVLTSTVQACPAPIATIGWIDTDGTVVLRLSTRQRDMKLHEVLAFDVISDAGYLVPGFDVADPFGFFLANSPNQVTASNLGFSITVEGSELRLPTTYDVEGALAAGVNPSSDLSAALTCGPGVIPPDYSERSFTTIPGDVNFDLVVNFDDFLVLAANYGTANATWPDGDFNWDGVVGFPDFLDVTGNYVDAAGLDETTSVPEPSSNGSALLALCLLLGLRTCRKSTAVTS